MGSLSPRILYVDDDPDNCEVMSLWLQKDGAGYEITAVTNVRHALSLIPESPFDLYIFDFSMPEVDGADMCDYVRKLYPDARIMIYSALDREGDMQCRLQAAADHFFIKPNDFDRFLPTVRSLLGRTSSGPNSALRQEADAI